MVLPNQSELLNLFSSFLIEAGLSSVSIKNYLSDLRHFLNFCDVYSSSNSPTATQATIEEVFKDLNKFLTPYTDSQKATFTPQATTNRRLASIRRFTTFLSVKFSLPNLFTQQNISEQNIRNNIIRQNLVSQESNQTTSTPNSVSPDNNTNTSANTNILSSAKILEQFKVSLEKEKKTHSTIKNYLSDLNHFFLWTANQTPFTTQNLFNILSESQLQAYITYLKLCHTGTSVINRRQSSIKKLTRFCFTEGYIPDNPFEIKNVPQRLAPLAWIERLARKPKKVSNGPKNRFAILYDKYNALAWTPYLNIALLVLLTTAMGIFAYNQIVSQARPGLAATALTPPKRQLSFQGRLTDTSGTPITTAVNVVFKLFNALTGPTQLYTSGTCSITPDQDGIFNSLIGDTVCGAEIPSSVFTDNRDVYLEIGVGAETLTPRQQIATVGYALNSETLQGYPASASATINTVPVIDNSGNINIAVASPSLISSSGVFTIKGQSLALKTEVNSGGDIILQPDALGSGQILAIGGTTAEDSLRVTNSNLTTGALVSGYVGSDLGTGRLLSLSAGSAESDRFWVAVDGRTSINTATTSANMSALTINQGSTGNLISASTSGVAKFTVTNGGNVDITGTYLVNGVAINSSNWQRTLGSLAPLNITDSINLGSTATSSALVHLAGTAGENSFINTGSLGVGTTTPDNKTEILGTGRQLRLTYTDASVYSEIYTGSDGALYLDPSHASNAIYLSGNSVFLTSASVSQWNHTNGEILLQNATINGTAGTATPLITQPYFSPASGNMNMDAFTIQPNIIQSGTATGNYTALKVNVTESNVLGSTNYLAQLGVGGIYSVNIKNNGYLGLGLTNPAYPLDISGELNLTDAIRAGGNAGTSGYLLTSSGGGVNTWTDPSTISGVNYWQRTSGSVAPQNITDSLNLGSTATSSALVHLAGTAGENSFINTGNVGIGTTTPSDKLTIQASNTEATLGSEMISAAADRDFSSSTGNWSGTNWSIGSNVATHTTGANAYTLSNSALSSAPSSGNTYRVYFNVNTTTAGTLTMSFGGTNGVVVGKAVISDGFYMNIVATNSTALTFTPDGTWTGTIDDISVKQITTTNVAESIRNSNGTIGLEIRSGGNTLDNTLIGTGTGRASLSSTAYWNVGMGYQSLYSNSSGAYNTAVGTQSLFNNVDGGYNTAIGNRAMYSNLRGELNVAVGSESLRNNISGYSNAALGESSLYSNISGEYNSAFGYDALGSNTTGSNNVAIGYDAGTYQADGSTPLLDPENSIYIGKQAMGLNNSDNNSIVIGASALGLGANTVVLGNNSITTTALKGNVGIGLTNPAYKLDVTGELNLTDAIRAAGDAGTSGYVLTSSAGGVNTWTNPTSLGTNYWQQNTGVLSPINILNALNLGNTATNSATVHLAGTPGDNSFINTGYFGIGLTNPGYTLDVFGDINLSGGIRAGASFGISGQILSSTGTGVQWIPAPSGSGSNWTVANGSISPNNGTLDAFIGGAATSSAKFAFINVSNGTPTASISGSTANVNTYLTGNGNLATTNMQPLTVGGASTGPIQLSPKGTTGLNVSGAGNVGIGLTNPSQTLDVTGTAHVTSTVTLDSLTANRLVVTDGSKNLTSTITSANLASSISDETGTLLAVFSDSPTFTTQITSPAVLGGTGVGSSLSLQSTSGAGSTDFINFKVGNNGAIEAGRFDTAGRLGLGTTSPLAKLDVRAISATTPVASISGSTNQASLIIDQTGNGDLFAASASGTTRFKIDNLGNVTAAGTMTISSLSTGIVHSDSNGLLTSSAVNLASSDITGILALANGGTNNNNIVSPYVSGKFLAYDGTRLSSTAYDSTSFEAPLTFSNGLTRTVNAVTLGGTLTQTTTIAQAGYDMIFNGSGNFGIGVASPSAKFDVAGIFVVDSITGRVGIGTTTPSVALDIAGTTSTISNSAGDITFNSASGFFNFSGDSLTNILDATISGQLTLGNYPTAGLPAEGRGTGSIVYDSTVGNPKYWDGAGWKNIAGFFNRTAEGIIYPSTAYDSINIGGTPGASSSALIRLSSNTSFGTFFSNPVAFGFTTAITPNTNVAIQTNGDILPQTTSTDSLGRTNYSFNNLYLESGINNTSGTQKISIVNTRLTGGTPWSIVDGARIGDTSNTLPGGVKLYVSGAATVSGAFGVEGNSSLIGDVTVGGGTGKVDAGTIDPPYTINGEKYATFLTSMIGVKEEVMGKTTTSQYVAGLGYRSLIDLDGQVKGSDLWLFGKTTNIKENIDRLSVLLTAQGQAKTWYEIDQANKILAIYSSTSTDIIYRLTAPRFDDAKWTNTRTSESIGFIINDSDVNNNIAGSGFLNPVIPNPELIAKTDGSYELRVNGQTNREINSFAEGLIANLKVGTQVVFNLVADNLTIRTKLISPIADIDSLKVIDATVSGTLYADNIKGKTVDNLTAQLDLLNEKYSTASAILSDLQAKYTSYSALLGSISTATMSGDPLALSPLATTSAVFPSDLSLNSLNVHTIYSNDILANGSVLAQSFSSIDTDLFIQPTGDKPVHLLANLMTLYPDGKVVISGDLLITGTIYSIALDTRTATVSGTLALGRGELATDSGKLMALFDKSGQIVGSVDASGSANFGQLTTDGLVIASGNANSTATMSAQSNSNTTIGIATIASGSAEISVANNKVTDRTLIYITPISNTGNQVLYVKSKTSGLGFTVAVPTNPINVTQEISFNYWLVETK